MVYDAEQTARNAEAVSHNIVGHCLQWCRQRAGIPARDGTAAIAWANAERRHTDRAVPRGGFAFWTGGSKGYGHIAIGLGDGLVRSTDADGAGHVATRELGWFDVNWPDLTYAGWADNVNGVTVPGVGDWFDMATEAELRALLQQEIAAAMPSPEQIAEAVWEHVVRKESKTKSEQTAQAALKKSANR